MITAQWDVEVSATTDELDYRRIPWPRGDSIRLRPRFVLARRPHALSASGLVRLYIRALDGMWYHAATGSHVSGEVGRVDVIAPPTTVQDDLDVIPYAVAVHDVDGQCVMASGAFDVVGGPGGSGGALPTPGGTVRGIEDVPVGASSVAITYTEQTTAPVLVCSVIIPAGAPLVTCAATGVTHSGATVVLSAPAPSDGYQIAWRIM